MEWSYHSLIEDKCQYPSKKQGTKLKKNLLILYPYWLGMRVIALLLSPMYQLFSEATPRKIVGTERTIKVHWFKLNDVYNGMILSLSNRGQMSISIQK
jgi:hypothetical protein